MIDLTEFSDGLAHWTARLDQVESDINMARQYNKDYCNDDHRYNLELDLRQARLEELRARIALGRHRIKELS